MSAINTENNASPDKALTQAELALKTVQDVLHNGVRVIGLQKYEDFMISPFNRSAFLSSLSRGENLVTNRWKISKDSRTFGGAMQLLEWFKIDAALKGLEFSYRLANDHISATRKPVNNCHITFTYTKKADEGNVVMALGLTHYMDNDSVGFALAHDPEITFPNVDEILEKFEIRLDSVVTLLNVVKGEVVARQIKVNINKQRAHDAFYPFIEDGIENLRDQFLASKSNVLTFTGIHGSGKSTLARYIGSSLETTRLFIVSDPSIYVDPTNMALIMQYIYNLLGELDESDEDDEEKQTILDLQIASVWEPAALEAANSAAGGDAEDESEVESEQGAVAPAAEEDGDKKD